MATVTRENIGTLHEKITVKLAREDYWPSFEKSLKQYAKQANVPGFRKGMVPAGMVRKMYGQSIFGDEVVRTAGRQLEEYLQSEKLAIFAQPMVMPNSGPTKLDMNEPGEFDFAFEIGVKPDFEITPIKNKTALTRYRVNVSDKMVDDEVEKLRKRFGSVAEMEVITAKEDIIYSNFEPSDSEGNVAEGAEKIEDTEVMEKFPAKLQELLMGKKTGDSIVFRPADIAEGDGLKVFLKDSLKSGPEAADDHFRLTITKIGLLSPAEMNAEFFEKVLPNEIVADEADFKGRIRKELNKEFERITGERLHNEIYELLVHNTAVQLPEGFLKRWMREGQETPKTAEEVEREFPSFDHQLRWTLISDKLIGENGISVSKADVEQDIKTRVLAYFGMDADEDAPWMESYMQKVAKDEKTMDETYRRLLFNKLFTWLEEQFDVTDKEVTEEEFFALQDPHATHHHHHH